MKRAFSRAILVLSILSLTGCDQAQSPPEETEQDLSAAATEQEVGFKKTSGSAALDAAGELAEETRHAHDLADRANTDPLKREALAALEQVTRKMRQLGTPHSIAVQQDLSARTAGLLLEAGRREDARTELRMALALTEKPTILRANLFITLADVEEAEKNHDVARAALMEALKINQTLLDTELEKP